MSAGSGKPRGGGGGRGGGNEKEVISGLFLTAFCQPPSEIFRGETHRSCVLVEYQPKNKGCKRVYQSRRGECVKLASDKEEQACNRVTSVYSCLCVPELSERLRQEQRQTAAYRQATVGGDYNGDGAEA